MSETERDKSWTARMKRRDDEGGEVGGVGTGE